MLDEKLQYAKWNWNTVFSTKLQWWQNDHFVTVHWKNRYINNGWSTSYWPVVRCWSRIQDYRWRSRSRWSDIWRTQMFAYIFVLNVNTVKTLNFTKLSRYALPYILPVHAYWPLSCIWLVKLLLKYNLVTVCLCSLFIWRSTETECMQMSPVAVTGQWPAKVMTDLTLTLICSPSHGYNLMTSCYL